MSWKILLRPRWTPARKTASSSQTLSCLRCSTVCLTPRRCRWLYYESSLTRGWLRTNTSTLWSVTVKSRVLKIWRPLTNWRSTKESPNCRSLFLLNLWRDLSRPYPLSSNSPFSKCNKCKSITWAASNHLSTFLTRTRNPCQPASIPAFHHFPNLLKASTWRLSLWGGIWLSSHRGT